MANQEVVCQTLILPRLAPTSPASSTARGSGGDERERGRGIFQLPFEPQTGLFTAKMAAFTLSCTVGLYSMALQCQEMARC